MGLLRFFAGLDGWVFRAILALSAICRQSGGRGVMDMMFATVSALRLEERWSWCPIGSVCELWFP